MDVFLAVVKQLTRKRYAEHAFVERWVYLDGAPERTLLKDQCGFVTYYDVNAGAVDGTNHCGRSRAEHPVHD